MVGLAHAQLVEEDLVELVVVVLAGVHEHVLAVLVELGHHDRVMPIPLMRGGEQVAGLETLAESRERLRAALVSVPWEGLKLSRGEPALPTVFEGIR